MTSNECSRCGRKCPGGAGLSYVQKHPHTGKWLQWRHCKPCAKAEGDLQDERAQKAIEQAERAGA